MENFSETLKSRPKSGLQSSCLQNHVLTQNAHIIHTLLAELWWYLSTYRSDTTSVDLEVSRNRKIELPDVTTKLNFAASSSMLKFNGWPWTR